MEKVRTITLVTFVSVLIWAFAEGQSVQTVWTEAEVEFPTVVDGYSLRVLEEPGWGQVNLQVEGSTSSLEELESDLGRAIRLEPGMEGVPRESGEHTVDLRQALRAHPVFRSRGVAVVSAEPESVRVAVDELTTIQADVRVDAPVEEIAGAPEAVEVSAAAVRLPKRAADALEAPPVVIARVRPEEVARFDPGRPVTLRGVRLEPGPQLAGVQPLEIIPAQVDVRFVVRSKTETTTVQTVPVELRIGPDLLREWEVEVPPEEQYLKDVRVTGPAELIEQIRANQLRISAYVRISYEDVQRGVTSKLAEFTNLPSPLTIEAEDREVRLTVRRRGGEENPQDPLPQGP